MILMRTWRTMHHRPAPKPPTTALALRLLSSVALEIAQSLLPVVRPSQPTSRLLRQTGLLDTGCQMYEGADPTSREGGLLEGTRGFQLQPCEQCSEVGERF